MLQREPERREQTVLSVKKRSRKSKVNINGSRLINLSISRDTIENQIAATLYQFGVINDNEDILSIKIEGLVKDIIPVEVTFRKRKKGDIMFL